MKENMKQAVTLATLVGSVLVFGLLYPIVMM